MKNTDENKHWSVRRQIADALRTEIRGGKLPAGTVIPTSRELAARYGTSLGNAHYAHYALAREGLITRRQWHGSVVNERPPEIRTVALAMDHAGFYGNTYLHRLAGWIEKVLARHGVRQFLELGPGDLGRLKRLRALADRGEIQAVINHNPSSELLGQLAGLSVPVVNISPRRVRNTVELDSEQALALAFDAFRRRGCRRVGYIVSGDEAYNRDFLRAFRDHAERRGMATAAGWQIYNPDRLDLQEYGVGRFAYEALQTIWRAPEQPDGVLLFQDGFIPGLLAWLLEAQVRVPDELRVVATRNREIPVLCPLPVDWIETSIEEFAEAAVKLLLEVGGDVPERVKVPYRTGDSGA